MLVIYTHPFLLFSQHRLQQWDEKATMAPHVFFFVALVVTRGRGQLRMPPLCFFNNVWYNMKKRGGHDALPPPPPCFFGINCYNKRKRGATIPTLCFFLEHLLQQEEIGARMASLMFFLQHLL